jgi:phosphate transport system protein
MSARISFERQLRALQGAVVTEGEMVDKAISRAADALERRSVTLAQRVVREDARINRHRADVEAAAHLLLGTQQPAASDLRFVTSALHLATDLERIGDHASNVGRSVVALSALAPPILPLPSGMLAMADLDRTRLNGALAALRARDSGAARTIGDRDAETDALQAAVCRELLTTMRSQPGYVPQATLLLRVAYAFERIGDHVTNLCERIVYAATGQLEELNTVRADQ